MVISVSLIKKYEDDKEVICFYGDYENEKGEFSINKQSFEVIQLKDIETVTDRIMFMTAVSKVARSIKSGIELPEWTSYNS